ncbi:MAG: tetratricopeptide repeat protein [Lutisporaceae bacterium]
MNIKKYIGIVFLCICLTLVYINALSYKSARLAERGNVLRENGDTAEAITSYEDAIKKDPKNSQYHSILAEMYKSMADSTDQVDYWRGKAQIAAEAAVKYSPYHPDYNLILTKIYLDSEQYIKAYEQAEKLVKYQPQKSSNYDLLTETYMKASLEYIKNKDIENAKSLITKVLELDKQKEVVLSPTIYFYKGKAMLMMGELDIAEGLLIKAKDDPVMVIDSDRLLYIIYEIQNRTDKIEKYKDVLWMAYIKKNVDYIETKEILYSKILH